MTNALLVSTDPYVISEMQHIANVTGAQLVVSPEPEHHQLVNTTHIFVDSESTYSMTSSVRTWVISSGPAGPQAWKCATQVRAEQIVSLPEDRATITQALATAKPRRANVIAIVGLGHGAGASTLACHVAAALSREHEDVVLVDTHLSRGGLEILLGREQESGLDWTGALELLKDPHRTIYNQLPRWNNLSYLVAPIASHEHFGSLHRELMEVVAQEYQHVVIDVDVTSEAMEIIDTCDSVCFVIPNTLRAVAIAKSELASFGHVAKNHGLVVRDVPGSSLAPLMVAQALEMTLWSALPTDARVVELMEQGIGPIPIRSGAFNRSITSILQHIGSEASQSRAA